MTQRIERFLEWRNSVAGSGSERTIAARRGIGDSRVGRHLRESYPPIAETVIHSSWVYGVNRVDGLEAVGLIEEGEALRAVASSRLRSAIQLQLVDELTRREKERLHDALGAIVEPAQDAGEKQRRRRQLDNTTAVRKDY
ncbi:hypothetical protein [Nocardia seriolae]|uniref:hypothetical protein n=1 Tax=Nocardia seriolae TaxID=37332 RepID=UPI0011AB6155|nr:hypothetical protein [Nocardia seriolae]MTJ65653.1 hypothetical protein [Nocardia seriolae]MTJ74898.1 hypothetical protein [Nocardia seriolae]MTJ86419.1 hypothetical protein [Nocardia seriolae]MTK30411.1 hypothetical protein [Nocardia seriolae]MTK43647.1 hypothetical protein [Nocardia seriolae]